MKIATLTSRDNPRIKQIKKISGRNSAYTESKLIWIEGDHLCDAYLSAKSSLHVKTALVAHSDADKWLRRIEAVAAEIIIVSDDLMAYVSALPSASTVGFLLGLPQQKVLINPTLHTVVLDRIQDAGNVGSILRSAAAFGVQQILALEGTALLWSPKVLRAAMGAHFSLQLIEGLEVSEIDLIVPLLATHVHEGNFLHELGVFCPSLYPCAWLFGHEGQGLSQSLLNKASMRIKIEQVGQESLNVAAAAAVCLYSSLLATKQI